MMRKALMPIVSVACGLWLLCVSQHVAAWDGSITGQIHTIEVTHGSNLGFRVSLVGLPILCAGGQPWAYLNETDSNYKTYVAVLLLARAQSSPVVLYMNREGSYCHIGHIQLNPN